MLPFDPLYTAAIAKAQLDASGATQTGSGGMPVVPNTPVQTGNVPVWMQGPSMSSQPNNPPSAIQNTPQTQALSAATQAAMGAGVTNPMMAPVAAAAAGAQKMTSAPQPVGAPGPQPNAGTGAPKSSPAPVAPASKDDNQPPQKPTLSFAPTPDIKPLEAPPPDPRIQQLFDSANELRNQAKNLDVPKLSGLNFGQALVGIVGAIATQGNPHAQFVANYLPQVANANLQQYGNAEKAWQATRQDLLEQADRMQSQASGMQQYEAEIFRARASDYSRIGAAQIGANARMAVGQLQADSRNYVADQRTFSLLQKAGLDANNVSVKSGLTLVRDGSPSDKAIGYQMIQSVRPDLKTDDINALAQQAQYELNPRGQQQAATADLKTAQAQTVDAMRDPLVQKAIAGNRMSDVNYQIASTKLQFMPAQLRASIAGSLARSDEAQAKAKEINAMPEIFADRINSGSVRDVLGFLKGSNDDISKQMDVIRNNVKELLREESQSRDANRITQIKSDISGYENTLHALRANFDGNNASMKSITSNTLSGKPAFNTPAPSGASGAVNSANANQPLSYVGGNDVNAFLPRSQTRISDLINSYNAAIKAGPGGTFMGQGPNGLVPMKGMSRQDAINRAKSLGITLQ